jgi:hypothetical protein
VSATAKPGKIKIAAKVESLILDPDALIVGSGVPQIEHLAGLLAKEEIGLRVEVHAALSEDVEGIRANARDTLSGHR